MSFQQKNLGVIICSHVRDHARPILLVTHFDNEDWAFTCGGDDHSEDDSEYVLVGVGHLTERDRSLDGISDLESGYSAERFSIAGTWNRYPDPDAGEQPPISS